MKKVFFIAFACLMMFLSSCHHYSFTGANTTAKTLFIANFDNKASNAPATIAQQFTESLKDKFIKQTSLELQNSEAELNLSGSITAYSVSSEAATSAQSSAVNRLTIRVKVTYYSTSDQKDKWEQEFSRYSTFSSSQDLSSVQDALIEDIFSQLTDDIFTKALVKW